MSIAYEEIKAKLSFGRPDRLAKALDVAGVTSNDMAEYLGVTRTTISNYTNGRTEPKKQTLRLWAMRTGVPLEWIEAGEFPEEGTPDGGGAVTFPYQHKPANWDSNVSQMFPNVSSRRNDAAA